MWRRRRRRQWDSEKPSIPKTNYEPTSRDRRIKNRLLDLIYFFLVISQAIGYWGCWYVFYFQYTPKTTFFIFKKHFMYSFLKKTSGLQFGVTFTSAFTMYFYIITRAKKRPGEHIRSVIENGKKLRARRPPPRRENVCSRIAIVPSECLQRPSVWCALNSLSDPLKIVAKHHSQLKRPSMHHSISM